MATCIEVSGAGYPAVYEGNEITPLEGVSIFKILNGNTDTERVLTFEHSGHPAIRIGDWKLVSCGSALEKNGFIDDVEFELYNIAEDRSETTDLKEKYPEKVQEMKKIMLEEFQRTKVLPRPF